jgi:hypothetical protein
MNAATLNTPGRETAGPFTETEFLEELNRMREFMGDRRFWAKPEAMRKAAVDGLAYMYFRCEDAEKVASLFLSTMNEYTRRETLGIIHGLVNLK